MDWLHPDIIMYEKVCVLRDTDFPHYKNVYSFGMIKVILKDGTKDVAHPPAFTDCCSISFRGLMKKACHIATHYKIHLGNKDFFKAVYVLGD